MNFAQENSPDSRQKFFDYSCPPDQWSQIPPQYMPWGHPPNSPAAPLVTFHAEPQTNMQNSNQINSDMSIQNDLSYVLDLLKDPQPSTSSFGQKSTTHCKRKANLDEFIPSKQHITEEQMSQHMSRLHISTQNNVDTNIPGEDSLSRQKRLYLCEEMRKLQTEHILPSSLLGRLERPCMAVMLWQPPSKIPSMLSNTSNLGEAISRAQNVDGHNVQEDENENNLGTADLNNMDMDA